MLGKIRAKMYAKDDKSGKFCPKLEMPTDGALRIVDLEGRELNRDVALALPVFARRGTILTQLGQSLLLQATVQKVKGRMILASCFDQMKGILGQTNMPFRRICQISQHIFELFPFKHHFHPSRCRLACPTLLSRPYFNP